MKWLMLICLFISAIGNCQNEANKEKSQPPKVEFIKAYLVEAKTSRNKKEDETPKDNPKKKELKDCIKPNNLIDDEVIKCMENKE